MHGAQYIIAGRFIDGSAGYIGRKVLLTIGGGIINAIGSLSDLPPSDGGNVHDFSHCTLLPALVDCSVSLARSPSIDPVVRAAAAEADASERYRLIERHVSYCHAYGVLGLADADRLSGSERDGAEQNSDACIKRSAPFAKDGSDFLRISYSPDIEDEKSTTSLLSQKELAHVVACRGERKVVVVANGPRQVAEALAAGCDAIEQGYGMGEENLRFMARNNVLWIPSVLRAKNSLDGAGSGGEVCCRFSLRYVAPGKAVPGAEAFWKKSLAKQLGQMRLARELGVITAVGTGAGCVAILHGESMVEEMKLFLKAGYSLEETVRCASENGARFFAMQKLGALAVGRPATFLITRGTAQQLPRKLSYLEGIYIDGKPSGSYHKNPVKAVATVGHRLAYQE